MEIGEEKRKRETTDKVGYSVGEETREDRVRGLKGWHRDYERKREGEMEELYA